MLRFRDLWLSVKKNEESTIDWLKEERKIEELCRLWEMQSVEF